MRTWGAVADQEARSQTLGWNHYLPYGNDRCWASLSRKYCQLYIFFVQYQTFILLACMFLVVFNSSSHFQSFPVIIIVCFLLNQAGTEPSNATHLGMYLLILIYNKIRLFLSADVCPSCPCNNCSLIYQKNPTNFPLIKFLRGEKCSIYICLLPKFAEKKSGNKFTEKIFLKRQALSPDRNLF